MTQKVWTAEEIEKLTPVEQDDLFDQSIVTDLADVPPEFLDRARARLADRITSEASDRR